MITALDLAHALVYLYSDTDYVTNMKLNKLVYLAYARALHNGDKIFNDEIQAWQYGPVIPNVYQYYKDAGSCALNKSLVREKPSSEALGYARDIWSDFGEFGAWDLMQISHREDSAWSKSYTGVRNVIISDDDILSSSDGFKPELENSFATASKKAFDSLDSVLKMLADS